jgi:Fe-S-cluster formation regulator IscX/YfhJ
MNTKPIGTQSAITSSQVSQQPLTEALNLRPNNPDDRRNNAAELLKTPSNNQVSGIEDPAFKYISENFGQGTFSNLVKRTDNVEPGHMVYDFKLALAAATIDMTLDYCPENPVEATEENFGWGAQTYSGPYKQTISLTFRNIEHNDGFKTPLPIQTSAFPSNGNMALAENLDSGNFKIDPSKVKYIDLVNAIAEAGNFTDLKEKITPLKDFKDLHLQTLNQLSSIETTSKQELKDLRTNLYYILKFASQRKSLEATTITAMTGIFNKPNLLKIFLDPEEELRSLNAYTGTFLNILAKNREDRAIKNLISKNSNTLNEFAETIFAKDKQERDNNPNTGEFKYMDITTILELLEFPN